jgi:hypothetical protein
MHASPAVQPPLRASAQQRCAALPQARHERVPNEALVTQLSPGSQPEVPQQSSPAAPQRGAGRSQTPAMQATPSRQPGAGPVPETVIGQHSSPGPPHTVVSATPHPELLPDEQPEPLPEQPELDRSQLLQQPARKPPSEDIRIKPIRRLLRTAHIAHLEGQKGATSITQPDRTTSDGAQCPTGRG